MRIFLYTCCFWVASFGSLVGQIPDTTGQAKRQELYAEALELMGQYQYEEAQKLLSQCYIEKSKNIDFILKVAYCNAQMGRYPDAKLFYGEALKVDSLNTLAISALGAIYEQELNYRKSFSYYQRLIQMDTTNGYFFKRNGYLALRLGDPLVALGYFLRAYEISSNDVEAMLQITNIFLSVGQLEEAEKMANKVNFLDPNNIKNLHNRARLYQKQKEYEQVASSVNRAMQNGDTTNYYQMLLGVAYVELDSLDEAISTLTKIIERKKDNEYTHHYLAIAYRDRGEIEESIKHFQIAIEKGASPKMHAFHEDLARVYVERNQHRKALTHFAKAYEYKEEAKYLFQMARSADLYYKDKSIAMRHYKKYVASGDPKYRSYAQDRIKQLKEVLHFQKG
ncbi:MAG: tetratricopeptide repeat protein [Bacteroidota bacterium]